MGDPTPKRFTRILGLLALLVCIPLTARADAGTPLMWAGLLHLVFGNAIIGVFEGLLLAWIFKLRKGFCVLVMIPANYFSAWVGGLFLNQEITTHLPFDLYNAWGWFWTMVLVTYLLTLILEWPFVILCFFKQTCKIRRSWRGNLLVNSVSYVLLFGWYWMASGTSLYTKMNIVQPQAIAFPQDGFVYFISTTNSVCQFDFKSRQIQKVCSLEATKDDRLFVKASTFDTNNWDILDTAKKTLVSSNLTVMASPYLRDGDGPNGIEGTSFNFGEAPKLAERSDWNFETGFWPIEGLRGKNQKTGEIIHFSLETPFVAWNARNATHLPGDFVVFQLGEDQICLFEIATKKVALLAKGQGPVVVLPRRGQML
jgi:hypothetical protein